MQIYQPQSYPKNKHHHKAHTKQQELQHGVQLEKLDNEKWMNEINKEVAKFESTIHKIEEIMQEAQLDPHPNSFGSMKLVQDDYKYANSKFQNLRDSIKNFKELLEKAKVNESKKLEYTILKERDDIQLQFTIAHRVLTFIDVYIKLKDQYQDEGELQKHRDYILQKIIKIKLTEEKHQKKLHHYYQGIVVENLNDQNAEEQDAQEPQQFVDEEEEENDQLSVEQQARDDLIKLCACLSSYLSKFAEKEEDYRINHDLVTLQQFDQIKVAAPFHSEKIPITLELIAAKKLYYENVSLTDLIGNLQVKAEVKEKALDLNNENDFPKLE